MTNHPNRSRVRCSKMVARETRYHGPSNVRGSRVSARANRPLHGLWSLWDMLELKGDDFYQATTRLVQTISFIDARHKDEDSHFHDEKRLKPQDRKFLLEHITEINKHLETLSARVSLLTSQDAETAIKNDACTWRHARSHLGSISANLRRELSLVTLLVLSEKEKSFYGEAQLFGEAAFSNFPSANSDIYEAGACLALGRSTACVMHLNRVLECGLETLAHALGVEKQTDWGAYLRKIEKELDARSAAAGKRSADEQFYAEAGANFNRLRVAYRNPTMHPDKSYSSDRAEQILDAVKAFMAHLATRLCEEPEAGQVASLEAACSTAWPLCS